MTPLRWSLATGPIVMLGGVVIATTAATLLWEKYSQKSDKDSTSTSK